jgi:hypothetical protein
MRKFVSAGVAAALFAPALPALAEPAAPSSARPAAAPQPPRGRDRAAEPEICVSEQLTGSRMPRTVCHTARDWYLLHGDPSDDR